jgi:hypothetical protein
MFHGSYGQPTRPRTVAVGAPADLCVLAAPPDDVLDALDGGLVTATVVEGRLVYEKP